MHIETLAHGESLSVLDFRCAAATHDAPFTEQFQTHAIAYVRCGSFGYQSRGRHFELVPGSLLIGGKGDEYRCTHDHHAGGDACLSFHLSPDFAARIGGDDKLWRIGAVPPLPELMVLGELAWSATQGHSDVGCDEVGLVLSQRLATLVSGSPHAVPSIDTRQHKRAIEAALWIDDNSQAALNLDLMAANAGLSPFHFLRIFTRVLGVTPHQYLVRSRLRRATGLLAESDDSVTDVALDAGFNDLSNFVRTFRRAAGVSPGRFRQRARRYRKILQD